VETTESHAVIELTHDEHVLGLWYSNCRLLSVLYYILCAGCGIVCCLLAYLFLYRREHEIYMLTVSRSDPANILNMTAIVLQLALTTVPSKADNAMNLIGHKF
jgi:hypothetical protein